MSRSMMRRLAWLTGSLPSIYLAIAAVGVVYPTIGHAPWRLVSQHIWYFVVFTILCGVCSMFLLLRSRPPKASPLVCHGCGYALAREMRRCPECGRSRRLP
jgi:hypothetical protein